MYKKESYPKINSSIREGLGIFGHFFNLFNEKI